MTKHVTTPLPAGSVRTWGNSKWIKGIHPGKGKTLKSVWNLVSEIPDKAFISKTIREKYFTFDEQVADRLSGGEISLDKYRKDEKIRKVVDKMFHNRNEVASFEHALNEQAVKQVQKFIEDTIIKELT